MTSTMAGVVLFGVGVTIGAVVTRRLHRSAGVWAHRIARSRWRYANLPVGGVVTAIAAWVLREPALYGLAGGEALAALAGRVVDPLPTSR